jgi:hypothetical protein
MIGRERTGGFEAQGHEGGLHSLAAWRLFTTVISQF